MKTEHLGLRITDVPQVEHITVEPSEDADHGVRIVLEHFSREPVSFSISELNQFIGALEAAHRHAVFMAANNNGD